ncbi:PREDICTED: transcription factor GTE4 isoform X1 [Theobroma cacao]|uniref:Transcription factor GTE4 isoform X1 n=1 Tax=Theobroma cacao TaxID=3641 RepID=A0AB32VS06_THECC|nr:PREDICTED: transcription factor GTE4 isoform X1 [Theobroma cacao]XP_007050050.2 PREDICTED: transcription factor GTE4 isoform X1 [Theobroma cacao]
MASATVVGEGKDGAREKQRYTESKVYTRKAFKGPKKNNLVNTTAKNSNNADDDDNNKNSNNNNNSSSNNNNNVNSTALNNTAVTANAVTSNDDGNANDKNNDDNNNNDNSAVAPPQPLPLEDMNSAHQQPVPYVDTAVSDDSSNLNKHQVVASNGAVKSSSENRVKINLASRSKQEMRDLRRKLESELDLVRNLVKRIEAKEGQISGFSNSRLLLNDSVDYGLKRVQSEVASVGIPQEPVRQSRPLNQLSISVLENSQGNENLEKEKRTPKANQFYRNSEFLLAKDKFPPAESNKKSKLNGKKAGGGEFTHGFGMGNKFFKSCSSLLERLMKHKHGWVFNAPVDVKGLGLHDYYSIIKHPMDLGTVKSRLNKNWYKSPREFAEDVRLTFRNAMTYNPKGQDVHVMAEQLSKIFEDKWAVIETDYIREMRLAIEYEVSLPTPTPRKAHPMLPPPLDMRRILDRSESMIRPVDMRPKLIATTPSSRTPAPKKPKAKDPYKRDMTYEEKQKLSTNLQSLPSEKLDNIVQIIKKRNSALFQHDDEIEVDIDSVDTETLWELDRFVTNYKKSLSKNKRKAELAIQARAEAEQIVPEKLQTTPAPVLVEVPKEATTNDQNLSTSSPVEVDKRGDNASRSSSSSSSSSDSGSSSSDSDSESSSASGSDAGHSPRS